MPAVQNLVTLPAPDEAQTQALSADIQAQLAQLPTAITNRETYLKAKESLPLLKRAEDKVVAFFKDIKKAASDAHKAICAKENDSLHPIKQARWRVSSLIYGYEQEQERIRREQERQAVEEERQRREAAALEEAEQLQAHGAPEMAEQVLEQAIAAPTPSIALPTTKADVVGVSSAANWQFKYAGCASGVEWDKLPQEDRERVMRLLPREYLRPDEKVIGRVVKATKGSIRIPGIETYDAGTVRVRG